jgi:hypothetical protein
MHTDAVKRDVIRVAQAGLQIVGVQHGVLRDVFQSVGSVHGDIGVRTDEAAAEMSVEGFHATDAVFGFDEAIQRRQFPLRLLR